MTVTSIRAFHILKEISPNISEQTAEEFVSFIENSGKAGLATKEDIQALKEDIHSLEAKMGTLRVDLIKWVIAAFVASTLVTVGAVASLFKLYFQHS